MRETALATLFADRAQLPRVLTAIEAGILPPGAIDTARRSQLLKHKDDAIRQRAEALFKQPAAADRMRAYEASKAALTLAPHAATGREVFKRACANCHRLDREGVAVGPDLFDVRNQPKETLLLHIIVPEFEIAPNFTGYTLETRDGRTLSGLIAGETPTSVTLRQALGVEETVLRANIASLEASRLSIMPQEIEKTMSTKELADLLAYLKGEK
jgi:putative heme-binding domain-containing protein